MSSGRVTIGAFVLTPVGYPGQWEERLTDGHGLRCNGIPEDRSTILEMADWFHAQRERDLPITVCFEWEGLEAKYAEVEVWIGPSGAINGWPDFERIGTYVELEAAGAFVFHPREEARAS